MSRSSREIFLVGGVRTPQGRYGGTLTSVRPDDLAALVGMDQGVAMFVETV